MTRNTRARGDMREFITKNQGGSKSKLVFREWLKKRDLLVAYAKYRAADGDWGLSELAPVPESPHSWIGLAFNKYNTDEGVEYWADVENEWCADYSTYIYVEAGIPINDQLGMHLLLAELEDVNGNGKDRV